MEVAVTNHVHSINTSWSDLYFYTCIFHPCRYRNELEQACMHAVFEQAATSHACISTVGQLILIILCGVVKLRPVALVNTRIGV